MEEKSNRLQIQIFNPQKIGPYSEIFDQPNQQKINCRRQSTKPYLTNHYLSWIKKDTGSSPREIQQTDATAGS